MMKLLPILFLLAGLAAGYGAGRTLSAGQADCPDPEAAPGEEAADCPEEPVEAAPEEPAEDEPAEFVRMNDQFVIPVMDNGTLRSLVVMSLSLEVDVGSTAAIFAIEPKLRDAFLRVLFDHANTGGFDGTYTSSVQMEHLRRALLEIARKTAGPVVRDVLMGDILRQEA